MVNDINPFVPNIPFLYPLKTSGNLRFSDVFRGQRKGALGTDGLRLQYHLAFAVFLVDFAVTNASGQTFVRKKCSHKFRSSRPDVFSRKGVLGNFTKFTGKHLCQSFRFNKFAGQETLTQVFSCKFCEISKNTFSYGTPPVGASENSLRIFFRQITPTNLQKAKKHEKSDQFAGLKFWSNFFKVNIQLVVLP